MGLEGRFGYGFVGTCPEDDHAPYVAEALLSTSFGSTCRVYGVRASAARLDVATESVAARFGGRVAGASLVAGWDLATPGFTASHGFTNTIDW